MSNNLKRWFIYFYYGNNEARVFATNKIPAKGNILDISINCKDIVIETRGYFETESKAQDFIFFLWKLKTSDPEGFGYLEKATHTQTLCLHFDRPEITEFMKLSNEAKSNLLL